MPKASCRSGKWPALKEGGLKHFTFASKLHDRHACRIVTNDHLATIAAARAQSYQNCDVHRVCPSIARMCNQPGLLPQDKTQAGSSLQVAFVVSCRPCDLLQACRQC
jgi:hypothetical protein